MSASTSGLTRPRNRDRSLWAQHAVVSFAKAAGQELDYRFDPQTVLSDLLTDLMHWCDVPASKLSGLKGVDFESALGQAQRNYNAESAVARLRYSGDSDSG